MFKRFPRRIGRGSAYELSNSGEIRTTIAALAAAFAVAVAAAPADARTGTPFRGAPGDATKKECQAYADAANGLALAAAEATTKQRDDELLKVEQGVLQAAQARGCVVTSA